MDTYTCTIKLNITNGLGDKVFNEVQNAKVPDMIKEELDVNGNVDSATHRWDSGVFSHDLYLTYVLKINSYRLIKSKSCKFSAKVLKYSGYLQSTIRSKLQSSITDGFNNKLSGPFKHLAVVLRSCIVA